MKKLFKGAWYVLAGIGAVFAFIFLGGGSKKRLERADAKTKKAEELRARADLVGKRIEELKEKQGEINRETQAEIERIKGLDDLEEISREFDKLY